MTLHIYDDGCDVVIAASQEDAVKVWEETARMPYEKGVDAWEQVPDDKAISLCFPDEPDRPTEIRRASEWVKTEGRCYFSTYEY